MIKSLKREAGTVRYWADALLPPTPTPILLLFLFFCPQRVRDVTIKVTSFSPTITSLKVIIIKYYFYTTKIMKYLPENICSLIYNNKGGVVLSNRGEMKCF
jgi:hypothetical protein